jgi:hypothetical protein
MPTLTTTNPGTVCVASQTTPPAPSPATTLASTSSRCLDGEVQVPARRPTSSPPSPRGLVPEVAVASSSCVRSSPATTSTPTGHGLPSEVRGDACCARSVPAVVAPQAPTAVRVDACAQRPGGLPQNHQVR